MTAARDVLQIPGSFLYSRPGLLGRSLMGVVLRLAYGIATNANMDALTCIFIKILSCMDIVAVLL